MKELGENLGELKEVSVYEAVIRDIQRKLLEEIKQIKSQKEEQPHNKDWVQIQVRLSGTNLVMKKEFTFGEINIGIEEDLEKLIIVGKKNSKGRGMILNAFLFPYEIGGRKMLENYRIGFAEAAKKNEKMEIPPATIAEVEEAEQVLEVATVLEPVEQEKGLVAEIQEKIAEKGQEVLQVKDPIDEVVIPVKKLKVRDRSGDFYENPIDFDFQEWGVWKLDGTRNILRKIFELKGIVSPGDVKKFLGVENPSYEEWKEFIDRLNQHDESKKLKVGLTTELSLMRWMRKNKIIPIEFRENI